MAFRLSGYAAVCHIFKKFSGAKVNKILNFFLIFFSGILPGLFCLKKSVGNEVFGHHLSAFVLSGLGGVSKGLSPVIARAQPEAIQ
jgi:hypothetical protein